MDFMRFGAVMAASIDALGSTAHHVIDKDLDGNKEASRSHSLSEGDLQQDPEEDAFQSSKKGSGSPTLERRKNFEGIWVTVLFVSSFCSHTPLLLALLMVGAQPSNEDSNISHEELRTQNEEDEVSKFLNGTCNFTVTFQYPDKKRYDITLSPSAFEFHVCSWIITTYDSVIQSSKCLQVLFNCIPKKCFLDTTNESEVEIEFRAGRHWSPKFKL